MEISVLLNLNVEEVFVILVNDIFNSLLYFGENGEIENDFKLVKKLFCMLC